MLSLAVFKRTIFTCFFAALIITGFSFSAPAWAEGISPKMKQEIEAIVHDYIDENPEILVDAIRKLRERDSERRQQQGKMNLNSVQNELYHAKASPVIGNPKGDVTVIEFFDYRCPFCKKVFQTTEKLLKEDGNIHYIYKEFPILGPVSVYASQAALATWKTKPEKYHALHAAIMMARGDLTEERVLMLAEDIGLDTNALEKAMKDPEVEQEIKQNIKVAGALGITGTPSFIIENRIIPGAVSLQDLKDIIAEARKKK